MPKELLDYTLKLYVVPVLSPVAVNEAEVTPDCNTEYAPPILELIVYSVTVAPPLESPLTQLSPIDVVVFEAKTSARPVGGSGIVRIVAC